MKYIYEITILDYREWQWKRKPGAKALMQAGVPIGIVRRWQRVRRELTRDLRKRVAVELN